MSKITLNGIGSIPQNPTSAQAAINSNNLTIEAAFDNTLSLDGTAPNEMGSTLDMNSNQIVNLPAPATDESPLRLQDLNTFIGGGTITSIPAGGSTGDRLVKTSNADYHIGWGTESADLTAGANISITGSSPATVATVQNPNFTTSVTTPTLVLGGTSVTNISGTGSLAATTSPVLTTPALGTPSSGVLANCTGLPVSTGISGLGTSVGTFLATPSSANLAAAITDETGSGALVFATSPVFVTPTLGAATATTINKITLTAPATAATLTISNNKTAVFNNTLTFSGTDSTTMTFPTTSATVARTDAAQTFTGVQTFSTGGSGASPGIIIANSGVGVFSTASNTVGLSASGIAVVDFGVTTASRLTLSASTLCTGFLLSQFATGGVGYATGAGGAVTQITSRATGVTLNKVCGQITMFSAAGSATPATFTVTNSTVVATDTIHLCIASGATNTYNLSVSTVSAGSFVVTYFTTGGTATDAPIINFGILKGVNA